MNQAGTTPDELIHVGDSLQTDVEGANRAGVYSIWLNRQGRTNQTNIQPDFEIGSLAELLGLCERMA
jgi:putative hydrolase of the HAD superfamily